MSRTAFRYHLKTPSDLDVRGHLKELAARYSRYGYLMLHSLLKTEGLVVNKKHTYRLYTEEGLQVRTKKRKKLQRPRLVMDVPSRLNQRWSMDFVSGQLVSVSISGQQVARYLTQLIEVRDKPDHIVCDNGTEFISKAMFFGLRQPR